MNISKARTSTSFMFLVSGISYSCWAPMIPYAKENLELSESQLGLILLAFGIGALGAMPLAGYAVNRFGSKTIASIAAPCLVAMLPLLAMAPSALSLVLLLFAFGSAEGMLNVSMNAQSVAVEVHAGRPILSGFHSLFSLGGLVGAGSMSLLLENGLSLVTSALFLLSFLVMIIAWHFRHLLPASADIRQEGSRGFSWPGGQVLFYGIMCFILFLAEGAMLDWGALFLTSVHNYDVSQAGIGYAVFSIAMAIGRFFGDSLIARFGSIFMVRVGGLIAAFGILLSVTSGNYLELLGFFLIGLGSANIVPIMFGSAGKLPETSASSALTVVITLGYSGMLLGPTFIGFVAELVSLSFSLGFVALLLVAVAFSARKIQPQTL